MFLYHPKYQISCWSPWRLSLALSNYVRWKRSAWFFFDDKVSNLSRDAIDGTCSPLTALLVSVSIECHKLSCLVDTGAAVTAIKAHVGNEHLYSVHSNFNFWLLILRASASGIITSVDGFPLKILQLSFLM